MNTQKTTVLALDLRTQRFGFSVLKGNLELLDWGIKTYRADDVTYRAQLAQKRILPLLAMFRPSVIVANHVSGLNSLRGPGHHHIVRAVQHQVQEHAIEVVLLDRRAIRRAFEKVGAATKDDIAAHVTLLFPELAWKLPSRRKMWQPEHHNMPIFDATALGISYFEQFEGTCLVHTVPAQPDTPG